MGAPNEIIDLMNRFCEQYDSYRLPSYNEAQLRQEFVNPFFKSLGWDVDNEQGYAEAYKDVIHEDSIKIGGSTKAPDYSFRIGGVRKFFVETKKPAVNIGHDVSPAYQLRRYAWSAKLPLSILTDFEEFAVYDCRVRPDKNDKASKARTLYLNYEQYDDQWGEIVSIFSREAILKGSFDKYAESTKKKRGTAEVDDAFLKEIEQWRSELARNLALRNKELSQREINFAVQKTIDRIIFLRICEDRGIERYGQLQSLLGGPKIYARMCELFHQADDRYNSGLFHFTEEKNRTEPPDEWTLSLAIDDRALKEIIRKLYYPESPYEFSVLGADILGQVYEQFLGKVIRLTKGHQAKVEDKPEVKKAGGVYYTPTYIVDYIVEQTVGKLLEGKEPHQVAARTKKAWKPSKRGRPLTVLDPACGSGSFLIGAYQHLLDWYRDWYVHHDPKQFKDRIYQTRKDEWRLTTAERKRILLDHIYGVDIDPQAVEVTKLSLLLKVLEGENQESLQRQLRLFRERALPDLADNIKCGNSLIGPDFYQGKQLDLFDEEERLRINVFDWRVEFAEIMRSGGFDAVIGNPPYIRVQRIDHEQSDYFFQNYSSPTSKTDLSLLFLEQSLNLLTTSGRAAFICTSQWLATDYGRKLRGMLCDGRLHEIVDFGSLPVFPRVSTYPAIFSLSPAQRDSLNVKRVCSEDELNLEAVKAVEPYVVPAATLSDEPWTLGKLDLYEILNSRQLDWRQLKGFGNTYIGTKSGKNGVFVMEKGVADELGLEHGIVYPYAYRGAEVERYGSVDPSACIIYPYEEGEHGTPLLLPEDVLRRRYPNVYAHLASHKHVLRQRMDSRKLYAAGSDWYRHLRPGSFRYIRAKKFAFKGIATRAGAAILANDTSFDGANCPSVILEDCREHQPNYLLGLLNSKLIDYQLRSVCPAKLSGYTRFSASYITKAPIRIIDFSQSSESRKHDKISDLVHQMLSLHQRRRTCKTTHERTAIARQIEATDREIDNLVYELYGLSDEEICIVEEATA